MSELRRSELSSSCDSVSLRCRSLPSCKFWVRMHDLRRREMLWVCVGVADCVCVKLRFEIALLSCLKLKLLNLFCLLCNDNDVWLIFLLFLLFGEFIILR